MCDRGSLGGDLLSGDLLGNEPRSTLTPRTAYDVPIPSQTDILVIPEVRECCDECLSDRVTDFLGGLGLVHHPLSKRIITNIVSDTLAESIEFANLTFCQSGLIDGHNISFCRWGDD
jgi:hypothetical protein